MIKRYTFIRHPFYFVLENAKEMVNGLEKCMAIFYDSSNAKVEIFEFDDSLVPLEQSVLADFSKLRTGKERFNWLKLDQLPFTVEKQEVGQLSFSDEEQSSVLALRFKSKYDSHYDVLYFYFKNNIGNFRLSSQNEVMDVMAKEIIQNLLYNQVELMLKMNENDSSIHKNISDANNTGILQGVIEGLERKGFKQEKLTYQFILNDIIETEKFEVVLSNDAVVSLSEVTSSLLEAKQVLIASLEVLLNSSIGSDFYELTKNDLVFVVESEKKLKSIKQESLEKTKVFLDKYEVSAKLLVSRGDKITGLNIGNNCSPKVSPAAISDIFKKHHNKIVQLLTLYPDKWKTIRSGYKPLKSITNAKAYGGDRLFGA